MLTNIIITYSISETEVTAQYQITMVLNMDILCHRIKLCTAQSSQCSSRNWGTSASKREILHPTLELAGWTVYNAWGPLGLTRTTRLPKSELTSGSGTSLLI